MAMRQRVNNDIGQAVELLYNLDIALSNGFTGDPKHPNDKATKAIRKSLQDAMEALHSEKWIGHLKELA